MYGENVRSREDFHYVEIYRPVIGGMDKFMDRVRFHGAQVFGTEVNTLITEPVIEHTDEGAEPVMMTAGIESPRIDAYENGRLRLPFVERRALPRMNYGGKFSYALRRTINNPDEPVFRPIERSDEEEIARKQRKTRDSLAFVFGQIGLKYDIPNQDHLEVPCRPIVDIPVDPPLEHLGLEVQLVPDAKSEVVQMIVEQAGVCIRGLGRKSSKVANPWTPAALRIPFARMPHDARPREITQFVSAIEGHVPSRVVVGNFKDQLGSAPWQVKR